MDKEFECKLTKIIKLDSFTEVFSKLIKIDPDKTKDIENSLKESIRDIHSKIEDNYNDKANLKYLLYRESVELKAHASSYLTYSEMMATRENVLWRFAFDLTEQFFDLISDALTDYFDEKLKNMFSKLEKNYEWHTGLIDSGKKLASITNYSKKILKKGLDKFGHDILNDKEIFDAKSVVERILDTHLNIDLVSKDIGNILEEANNLYKSRWEQEIKTQAPDLSKLRAFSSYNSNFDINIGFEFGMAEQTLAVGISSAIVGSIGLAAGWHTLTYALLNVFPPVAIFAALGTLIVAVLTKNKALENRKKQIKEAVKQYHKQFLLQIETEKIKNLKNKTLREAMNEQSRQIIRETVKQWSKAISGQLSIEHYRMIISGFEKHMTLIDDCVKKIDK